MHVHIPYTIFCMGFFQFNVFTLMEGEAFENPMESHFAVSVFRINESFCFTVVPKMCLATSNIS